MKFGLAIGLLFGIAVPGLAQVQTRTIEYRDGDVVLEGFVAFDSGKAGSQNMPGVLVVHQWTGLSEYEKARCEMLANLGYIAFALDIYGKGIRPAPPVEAGKQATIYKQDRQLFRRRLQLGLEQLLDQPAADPQRVAAIGYCFGGTGVIELARSGADIAGVVSFHGGLDSPNPDDGKSIQAKILVCHGADDPFVPAKDIEAFKAELTAADVDWQMIY